jgi:hypothetical protein
MTPAAEVVEFRDHWADTMGEWSHGGAWFTSFLVPPKRVSEALAAAVERIDVPFLARVPAELMHVTVQGVARVEHHVTGRELHDVVEAVAPELAKLKPFDAAFGDPVVGYGGVFCDAQPNRRFRQVRDGFRRDMASLVPQYSSGSYWPYLALAYATGTRPIDSVDTTLLRPTTGVTWHVDTLTFVELRRTPGRYDWEILADVPLGH